MKMNARKITELEGHRAAIYTIARGFSDKELLSASSERFVASWNLEQAALSLCFSLS